MNKDDILGMGLVFVTQPTEADLGVTIEDFFYDDDSVAIIKGYLEKEHGVYPSLTNAVIDSIRASEDIDLACAILEELIGVVPVTSPREDKVSTITGKYFY